MQTSGFLKPRIIDVQSIAPNHAKVVMEPFERGYGHTLGNALRRVLLSSLRGTAITAVRVDGAMHEFSTIPGVTEDVTDLVLNLKEVRLDLQDGVDQVTAKIDVKGEKQVTAADIVAGPELQILNPEQPIATVARGGSLRVELTIKTGRGYVPAELNRGPDTAIGVIPIDSIYSPVTRVKYAVENTRVGQNTDYDKLILDVWTDGRITPDDALLQSSAILQHHLDVFVGYDKNAVEFEEEAKPQDDDKSKLRKLLNMSVNEIELSVRAANCLNNANITTVGQLAMKTEQEMLKYRNFGKKSLNEIKEVLSQMGLHLGMEIPNWPPENIEDLIKRLDEPF